MRLYLPKEIEITDDLKKNILEQLYYLDADIDTCTFIGDSISIEMRGGKSMSTALRQKVAELAETTVLTFKNVKTNIYFENKGKGHNNADQLAQLISSRQVVENFPGVFIYQGDFLRLMRGIDEIFKKFAFQLDAIEQDYPTTVPLLSMATNGYLFSFAQHAMFVSAAHPDFSSLEKINMRSKESSISLPDFCDVISSPQQMLAPTVCYHCFESLRQQKIPDQGIIFTALAKCHRNEHRTLKGLERLQTFTMREIIFFGAEKYIEEKLAACINHVKEKLQAWGLESRIVSASDPFFALDAAKKRSYQYFLGLKKELQLRLPYNNKWLAVASFNNHRDTLVKAYEISWNHPDPLFSGCVGYGYERFVFSAISQFGDDFKSF